MKLMISRMDRKKVLPNEASRNQSSDECSEDGSEEGHDDSSKSKDGGDSDLRSRKAGEKI